MFTNVSLSSGDYHMNFCWSELSIQYGLNLRFPLCVSDILHCSVSSVCFGTLHTFVRSFEDKRSGGRHSYERKRRKREEGRNIE